MDESQAPWVLQCLEKSKLKYKTVDYLYIYKVTWDEGKEDMRWKWERSEAKRCCTATWEICEGNAKQVNIVQEMRTRHRRHVENIIRLHTMHWSFLHQCFRDPINWRTCCRFCMMKILWACLSTASKLEKVAKDFHGFGWHQEHSTAQRIQPMILACMLTDEFAEVHDTCCQAALHIQQCCAQAWKMRWSCYAASP